MLAATLALLIERPSIVGPLPHRPATRAAALAFSKRALAFTGALIVSITSAGVGSIVLVRRANAEFRRQSLENMKSLIDGTIEDHKRKAGGQDGPAV
ncbi:MAG: hypothetical protein P4L46_20215 [Fimbriimonas sp.]|nr:hypothetical protein [Fimbriimonas sp.]